MSEIIIKCPFNEFVDIIGVECPYRDKFYYCIDGDIETNAGNGDALCYQAMDRAIHEDKKFSFK